MKTRQLGINGLKVSEICFGCRGLNSTYSHSLATTAIAQCREARREYGRPILALDWRCGSCDLSLGLSDRRAALSDG